MAQEKEIILFVEDNLVDRMAFERSAAVEFPYRYEIASTVRDAAAALGGKKFSAAVLDYLLPDGTAFDLFPDAADIPVIVVTGAGDEEVAVRAMKEGATDYLIKDPDYNYLKALPIALRNAIIRKKMEEELRRHREHLEELVRQRTAELRKEMDERKRTEEDKLRAYTELEQIFNSTPVGMRVVDRQFSTIHLNRRFMEMFSTDVRRFVRGETTELNRDMMKLDRILMKRIMDGETFVEHEMRHRLDDDGMICVVHASPYLDKDGSIIGIIENFTNITEMRTLQNGIMRIAEVERQRIGQDLHDGLGQNLTAVTFLLEALKEKMGDRLIEEIPHVEQIEGLVRSAIVQTRSLSRMLSPVEMEKNAIGPALEEMAAATEKVYPVSCTVQREGSVMMEDNQAATHLYYIAREAVTNSIKHGRAGHIHIGLTAEGSGFTMTVSDDGTGAIKKDQETGLGLRIMRYRAGIIGADFSAGNRDGGGFEVKVRMKT